VILDAFGDSFRFDREEFSITASIGIARGPVDGDTPHTLIQNGRRGDVRQQEARP
jgi:hypothetical protein